MSASRPKPRPRLSDFDTWPCTCSAKQLLHMCGCTCGAWSAAVRDYNVAMAKHAQAERAERQRVRDFLIRAPTKPVTFRTACQYCKHEIHSGDCSVMNCFCVC